MMTFPEGRGGKGGVACGSPGCDWSQDGLEGSQFVFSQF